MKVIIDFNFSSVSPTSGTVSPVDCSFDSAFDYCSWTQSRDDDFQWSLESGPTGSSNTGPSSDHTSGNSKYFGKI